MANYLRPRRGKKTTAESQLTSANPLKRGEIFFEVPTAGVGTGAGNIKMGDGATAYASLPYFINGSLIGNTSIAAIGDGTITGAISSLNNDLGTLYTNLTASNEVSFRFGYDSNSGKYGYILNEGGADTLVPFSAGSGLAIESLAVTTMPTKSIYARNENLDLSGIVVTATFEDGLTANAANVCTFEPANGTTLTTVGTIPITVTYQNITTTFNVTCTAIYDTVKNASTVTEAQWLEFVNSGCIKMARDRGETSAFIGKNVTLSNSVVSNYTSWKIADFNHDSSGNTVDLIQNNTIYNTAFSSSQTYSSSTARSWLTGTYLPGFSTNVKNKLQTMTVTTDGGNVNDKIKLLSVTEVGGSGTTYAPTGEGSRYPIFTTSTGSTANDSRVRTGTFAFWWLRSRDTNNTSRVWYVISTGFLSGDYYTNSYGLVPALRFA